jgi:hypothetical protein
MAGLPPARPRRGGARRSLPRDHGGARACGARESRPHRGLGRVLPPAQPRRGAAGQARQAQPPATAAARQDFFFFFSAVNEIDVV